MSIYLNWATRMTVDSLRGRNVKAALLDGYAQSAGDAVLTDVQMYEVAGTGYSRKSVVLDAIADPTASAVRVTSAPIFFGLLGVSSVNAIVFFDDTGNPSTSLLLAVDVFSQEGLFIDGLEFTYIPVAGTILTLSLADDTVIEP